MKDQRRASIEDYVMTRQTATMKELQSEFKVSMNTIRADIEALVNSGNLVKIYGGVRKNYEGSAYSDREMDNIKIKTLIAKKAAELIESGDSVYLDYGTTTVAIPDYLHDKSDITIITPNMELFIRCRNMSNINLIVLPGEYNARINGVVSDNTITDLNNYNIGKAFMATCGITPEGNICVSKYIQKKIKETVISLSDKKYLLMESNKFYFTRPLMYANISDIDAVITDNLIDSRSENLCKNVLKTEIIKIENN